MIFPRPVRGGKARIAVFGSASIIRSRRRASSHIPVERETCSRVVAATINSGFSPILDLPLLAASRTLKTWFSSSSNVFAFFFVAFTHSMKTSFFQVSRSAVVCYAETLTWTRGEQARANQLNEKKSFASCPLKPESTLRNKKTPFCYSSQHM